MNIHKAEIKKAAKLIIMFELDEVYKYMTAMGWNNRKEAAKDAWIAKHLDKYNCFYRSDVIGKRDKIAKEIAYDGDFSD